MKRKELLKLILSALFLALAFVLPYFTMQIPEIGAMLCPMHIPVLLCGFICGWKWGLGVGFIAPLFRSLILEMPPIFPTATCMAFELATYGAVAGIAYRFLPKKKPYIYCALIISMFVGRIVWGFASLACYGIQGNGFTMSMFISGAIVNAIPGIVIQIILVPILVMVLDNKKVINLEE